MERELKIDYRKSTNKIQKMHGVRNWNEMFRLENNEVDFVIRAYINNNVIGQVAVQDEWLFFLAVDSNYRNLGIGSELLNLAETEISNKHQFVVLNVQKEFQDMLIPFYKKRGYITFRKNEKDEFEMIKEVRKWNSQKS